MRKGHIDWKIEIGRGESRPYREREWKRSTDFLIIGKEKPIVQFNITLKITQQTIRYFELFVTSKIRKIYWKAHVFVVMILHFLSIFDVFFCFLFRSTNIPAPFALFHWHLNVLFTIKSSLPSKILDRDLALFHD